MSLPFTLPDWVPWWVPMVLLVPTLLYALAFLFMPFSVLGVKSRLESIEARLEDLQQEMRLMTRGIPTGQEMDFEDVYAHVPTQVRQEPVIKDRPPVVSPPNYYEDDEPIERPAPSPNARPAMRRPEPPPPSAPSRPPRSEPRLDKRW